jgi:hypothetical protein
MVALHTNNESSDMGEALHPAGGWEFTALRSAMSRNCAELVAMPANFESLTYLTYSRGAARQAPNQQSAVFLLALKECQCTEGSLKFRV